MKLYESNVPDTPSAPIDVRERVKQIVASNEYSVADISRAINYHKTTIQCWLSERYGGKTTNVEAAVVNWLRLVGQSISDDDYPIRIIETTAMRQVARVCEAAQDGKMAAAVGKPGLGKTIGLDAWIAQAKKEGIRHIRINCDVSTTYGALLKKIARALKLSENGTAANLLERICETLRKKPRVVLIDEAQHLNVRALEVLRAIHDDTGLGIAILGSMALYRTLDAGDRSHLELQQLQDRLHLLEMLRALTHAEIMTFAREWWGGAGMIAPEIVSRLRVHSVGRPRRLVRILTHARQMCAEGRCALSVEIVDQANQLLYRREEGLSEDAHA